MLDGSHNSQSFPCRQSQDMHPCTHARMHPCAHPPISPMRPYNHLPVSQCAHAGAVAVVSPWACAPAIDTPAHCAIFMTMPLAAHMCPTNDSLLVGSAASFTRLHLLHTYSLSGFSSLFPKQFIYTHMSVLAGMLQTIMFLLKISNEAKKGAVGSDRGRKTHVFIVH